MGCYPIYVIKIDFTKMYDGYSDEGEEIKAKPLIEHLRRLDPKLLTNVEIRTDDEVHVKSPDLKDANALWRFKDGNVLWRFKPVKETK